MDSSDSDIELNEKDISWAQECENAEQESGTKTPDQNVRTNTLTNETEKRKSPEINHGLPTKKAKSTSNLSQIPNQKNDKARSNSAGESN